MTRQINAAGISLIQNYEGLRLTSYPDVGGIMTVGYGHTGSDVTPNMTISQARADQLLVNDLAYFCDAVSRLVTVPINDNQFAALVSFAYNLGEGALEGSTLLADLNQGEYDSVPSQLGRWIHVNGVIIPGLIARRQAEEELWDTPT